MGIGKCNNIRFLSQGASHNIRLRLYMAPNIHMNSEIYLELEVHPLPDCAIRVMAVSEVIQDSGHKVSEEGRHVRLVQVLSLVRPSCSRLPLPRLQKVAVEELGKE